MGDKFYEDLVKSDFCQGTLNVVRNKVMKIPLSHLPNPLASTISLVMYYNSTPQTPHNKGGTREVSVARI